MTYHYSTIRFVPDAARGEFINVGAVAGDDENEDWEVRLISNLARARAIDNNGLLPAALHVVGELEQATTPNSSGSFGSLSLAGLRRLSAEMNNVVQLSPPAPIVAADAAGALDVVFEELVFDPASREFRFEKKHRAVKALRDSYRSHSVPADAVSERGQVEAGKFRGTYDFAVHNGRAVQLVNCWSFQLPNQQELADQVKAWAWVVRELREGGGIITGGPTAIEVPAELEIAAVYVPPKPGQSSFAFEEAQAAFSEVEVIAHTPETADVLGEHAATALGVAA